MTTPREDPPNLDNLARSLGELREEVTLLRATAARLERRLDALAPPIVKRPPKAQGLRQDEVGDAPLVGPGRTD